MYTRSGGLLIAPLLASLMAISTARGALAQESPPPVESTPPAAESTPPPAAPTAAAAPPTAPPKERSKIPAYVSFGVAGIGVVVGTIFGIKALGAKSDFDEQPTTDNADATDRFALIADAAFACAVTFGLAGAWLFVGEQKTPSEGSPPKASNATRRPGASLAPYATRNGGGAAARFTF